MKHRDTERSIQVYPHWYSQPYYELEAWVETQLLKKEEAMQWLQKYGHLPCNMALGRIGVFPTKERAESASEELCDTLENYPCRFIREKPLYMMMPPDKYIKEWSYRFTLLEDESLVRNYGSVTIVRG